MDEKYCTFFSMIPYGSTAEIYTMTENEVIWMPPLGCLLVSYWRLKYSLLIGSIAIFSPTKPLSYPG
jgi:hypothetical protein